MATGTPKTTTHTFCHGPVGRIALLHLSLGLLAIVDTDAKVVVVAHLGYTARRLGPQHGVDAANCRSAKVSSSKEINGVPTEQRANGAGTLG